jgi:hypothetical protein
MGTVICPLLLIVLDGGIFTSHLESKDNILYHSGQPAFDRLNTPLPSIINTVTTVPTPRVRFAPSPTGLLHVGNARTALYNWLFARRNGGRFILRIEDTDLERSESRHERQLIEDLRWLGLDWDEGPSEADAAEIGEFGPYRQSERLEIYARHTEQLLAEGKAYRCFCTAEELEAERQQAMAEHGSLIYSGRCRALPPAEIERNLAAGRPFAVRLKIGAEPLRFHDLVRGPVEFAAETVSDPILVRSASSASAGVPVYNYVVTVDDALMQDHPRHSRRRPHLEYAEAGGDLSGLWLAGAGVRASIDDPGARPRAALEAPRRDLDLDLPRDGLPARGAGELPGSAGLGRRRRQDRDLHAGGADKGLLARTRHPSARPSSTSTSSTGSIGTISRPRSPSCCSNWPGATLPSACQPRRERPSR